MKHAAILLPLVTLMAGCFGGDGELRFRDAGGVWPAAHAEAEIRMYKSRFGRWDFPALPGTPEAARRERRDPTRGNSLFLRAEVDLSSITVDGSDFSPWLEYIFAIPLDPGPLRSRMRITRGELLFRAGWCTRGRFFRIGGGMSGAVLDLTGSVRDPDTRISLGRQHRVLL